MKNLFLLFDISTPLYLRIRRVHPLSNMAAAAVSDMSVVRKHEREILSTYIKPIVYDLLITTKVNDGKFTGEETIT
jgi:hypothetical protein